MKRARLRPFVRPDLDILFVGKNPAKTSDANGHYFSTKPHFWNQLFESGLIACPVDMMEADDLVFGSNTVNLNGWQYGVTDLITEWAESDSSKVDVKPEHCERLVRCIGDHAPRIAVLMHSDVRDGVAAFLGRTPPKDYGSAGRWITGCSTEFFTVPFPHGTRYSKQMIVGIYVQIRRHLETITGAA